MDVFWHVICGYPVGYDYMLPSMSNKCLIRTFIPTCMIIL